MQNLKWKGGGVLGHIKIPHTARSTSMTRLTKSVLVYVKLIPSKVAWDSRVIGLSRGFDNSLPDGQQASEYPHPCA